MDTNGYGSDDIGYEYTDDEDSESDEKDEGKQVVPASVPKESSVKGSSCHSKGSSSRSGMKLIYVCLIQPS